MRPRRLLSAVLVAAAVASICTASSSGFAIDKARTFLGFAFPHGSGTVGVHEAITADALRRGMPGAPKNLVGLIQAGAENVDVTHHFDAEYHFDSSSMATFPKRFEKGFATVQSHLRGAAKLADRNPEFFDPTYPTFRAIAQDLFSSLEKLAADRRCTSCSGVTLLTRAVLVKATLPLLLLNKNPDPHYPTNPESVFASQSVFNTACGLCGKLWPINKGFRTIIFTVESASKVGLTESTALDKKDPLRLRFQRIYRALRAYRAFQALGHAFHSTQDFFAHSNYVELMAGVAVGEPIPAGTKIPVPQRRADFGIAGLRKVMGAARLAKLETGAANAIWLGEGDYCLGSLYNPQTKGYTVAIPKAITDAIGVAPISFTTPAIGTNPDPPPGLDYCHYPTSTNPGLNKDEPANPKDPSASQPSWVNFPFARQAAEDMTAVLWKSFLTSVHRPVSPSGSGGTSPTTPKKPAEPGAKPGTWTLKRTVLNPWKAKEAPAGTTVTVEAGHLNWKVNEPPQVEFDARYKAPPRTLSPGTYSFAVTVTGKLSDDKTVQGYRQMDVILLVADRWDGSSAVGVGQSCTDPIGAEPISCTPPSKGAGVFKIAVPTPSRRGETFSFAVSALNCTACGIRYEYVSR